MALLQRAFEPLEDDIRSWASLYSGSVAQPTASEPAPSTTTAASSGEFSAPYWENATVGEGGRPWYQQASVMADFGYPEWAVPNVEIQLGDGDPYRGWGRYVTDEGGNQQLVPWNPSWEDGANYGGRLLHAGNIRGLGFSPTGSFTATGPGTYLGDKTNLWSVPTTEGTRYIAGLTGTYDGTDWNTMLDTSRKDYGVMSPEALKALGLNNWGDEYYNAVLLPKDYDLKSIRYSSHVPGSEDKSLGQMLGEGLMLAAAIYLGGSALGAWGGAAGSAGAAAGAAGSAGALSGAELAALIESGTVGAAGGALEAAAGIGVASGAAGAGTLYGTLGEEALGIVGGGAGTGTSGLPFASGTTAAGVAGSPFATTSGAELAQLVESGTVGTAGEALETAALAGDGVNYSTLTGNLVSTTGGVDLTGTSSGVLGSPESGGIVEKLLTKAGTEIAKEAIKDALAPDTPQAAGAKKVLFSFFGGLPWKPSGSSGGPSLNRISTGQPVFAANNRGMINRAGRG